MKDYSYWLVAYVILTLFLCVCSRKNQCEYCGQLRSDFEKGSKCMLCESEFSEPVFKNERE